MFCLWIAGGLGGPVHCHSKTLVEALAELSLEQLMTLEVSSTSFFDIEPEKAPGSLYLVTTDEIDASYISSLADVLQYYVPGVHISDTYSAGPLLSTRGIASSSNGTTLFMLDGHSINVSNGNGINTNLALPLLGYVARIEVLKGPSSIIHGSGAINGFVNVIQKNGRDDPGGFVTIETGFPHNLLKAETGYGWSSHEKGDIFLYAGVVQAEGIDEDGTMFDSLPDANTRFSVNWQRANVEISAFMQDETVESPLKSRSFGQEYSKVAMKTAAILPEIDFSFTDTEVLTIGTPFFYFEYEPDFLSHEMAYQGLDITNLDTEWHLKSNILFKTTRFALHKIAMGGVIGVKRFQSDLTRVGTAFSDGGGEFMSRTDRGEDPFTAAIDIEWVEASLFFEDNYQVSPSVLLFAGLRYDALHPQSFDLTSEGREIEYEGESEDISTARLGLTWDVGSHQHLKLFYHEGYHYPGYINFLSYADSNDSFTIEKVSSYELGYDHGFMGDRCRFSLNLYYNIFENTLFFSAPEEREDDTSSMDATPGTVTDESSGGDASEDVELEISDRFVAVGLEARLHFKPDDQTWFDVSYGISHPHDTDTANFLKSLTDVSGDHWKSYPEHTVKFNMGRQMLDGKLMIALGCLYTSPIDTMEDAPSMDGFDNAAEDLFNHPRFVVNMGIRYNVSEHLALTLKGENILNNDVPATGYYYNVLNWEQITLEEPIYSIGIRWAF